MHVMLINLKVRDIGFQWVIKRGLLSIVCSDESLKNCCNNARFTRCILLVVFL